MQGVPHDAQHGSDADAHANKHHSFESDMLLCWGPKRAIYDETGCLHN